MAEAHAHPPTGGRVVIVGAGIAGLTAAIALDRAGFEVEVLERATALTQAGTALSLWPNALAALDRLGLAEAVAAVGVEEPAGTILKPSGREVVRLDQSQLVERLGTPTLIVHRGDLQRVLLDAASHLPVRLHTPALRVDHRDGRGGHACRWPPGDRHGGAGL